MNEQNLVTAIQPGLIISDYLLDPALKIFDLYGKKFDELDVILEIVTSVSWEFKDGQYVSSCLMQTKPYGEEFTDEHKEKIQCLTEIDYLFKLGIPGLEYHFILENNELKISVNSGALVLCMINKQAPVLLDFVPQMELIENLKQQKDWYGVIRACHLMLRTPDYVIPNEQKYRVYWNLGIIHCQINQHYNDVVIYSNEKMDISIGKTAQYYHYMHAMLNCLNALMEGDNFNPRKSVYYKTHKEKLKQTFRKIPQIQVWLGEDFFTEELDNFALDKKCHAYDILHHLYPSHFFIKGRFNHLQPFMQSLKNAREYQDKDYELSASFYLAMINTFPELKEEECLKSNDLSQIYYELGKLQAAWEKYDEAEKNCQEASVLYTGENEAPHILMVLGDIDFKRGNYQKAYKRFQTLADIEENSEDLDKFRYIYAWYRQGIAMRYLNNHQEALRCYREVTSSFVDIGFRNNKPVYIHMLYSLNCLEILDEEDLILKNKVIKKAVIYTVKSLGHLKKAMKILGDDTTKLEEFYLELMKKFMEASQFDCLLYLYVTSTQQGFHWDEGVFIDLMEVLIKLNKKQLNTIKEKDLLYQFCHQIFLLKPVNVVLCQKSIQLLWRVKPEEAIQGALQLMELYPEFEEVLLNINDCNFYEQLGHEIRAQKPIKALDYYLKAVDGISKKKQPALSLMIFELFWKLGGERECPNLLSIVQCSIDDAKACQQLVLFLLENVDPSDEKKSLNAVAYELVFLLSTSSNAFIFIDQWIQLIEKFKSMPNIHKFLINVFHKAKAISEDIPEQSVESHESLIRLFLDFNLIDLAIIYYLSVKNKPTDPILHKILIEKFFQWQEEGGVFVDLKKNPSIFFKKALEVCAKEDLVIACKAILLVNSLVRSNRKNLYIHFIKLIEFHPYHAIIQPLFLSSHKKHLSEETEGFGILLSQFCEVFLEGRKPEKTIKTAEFFVTAIKLYPSPLKKDVIELIVNILLSQGRNLFNVLKMLSIQGKIEEAKAIFEEIVARDENLYEKFIDALPKEIKIRLETEKAIQKLPDIIQDVKPVVEDHLPEIIQKPKEDNVVITSNIQVQEENTPLLDQGMKPLINLLDESKQEVNRLLETHSIDKIEFMNPKVKEEVEVISIPIEKNENTNVQVESKEILKEENIHFVTKLNLQTFPEKHPLRLALENNPYNIDALVSLAHFLFIHGRYLEALNYCNQIEYLSGTDETWMDFIDYHRSFILFLLKDYQNAIPYFEKIQSNYQGPLLDYLGIAYFEVEEYEKAMECFKKTEMLGLAQYSVDYYRGQISLLLENYTDAIFYYGRMIQCRPDERLKNLLGTAYYKAGNYEAALTCFEGAITIYKERSIISKNMQEGLAVFLYNKAMCYFKLENYAEAAIWLKSALESYKTFSFYDLLDLADAKKAVKDEKIWEAMPEENQFKCLLNHYLALSLTFQGHYEDALVYLNEAKILSTPKVENLNNNEIQIYQQKNSNLFFGKEKETNNPQQKNTLIFQ